MSPLQAIRDVDPPEWTMPALILATGVVVAGVSDFALSQAGYDALGTYVWGVGYGSAVLAVWFGWLRHLEFTPP